MLYDQHCVALNNEAYVRILLFLLISVAKGYCLYLCIHSSFISDVLWFVVLGTGAVVYWRKNQLIGFDCDACGLKNTTVPQAV